MEGFERVEEVGWSNGDGIEGCVGVVQFRGRGIREFDLGGEARAAENQGPEVGDRDPARGIAFEDAPQDAVQVWGQGQNGAEESGVLEVGAEGGVLDRGALPWIAAAGQVDQNDAQAPDIVGS